MVEPVNNSRTRRAVHIYVGRGVIHRLVLYSPLAFVLYCSIVLLHTTILQQEGSMKTKITTADIHNAVNDLIAEEKQPTLVAVRQKVGGGSYTTISEAMKSYKANKESEQQTPKEEAPSSVIASASQLAIDIWNVANNLANQKITHARSTRKDTQGIRATASASR